MAVANQSDFLGGGSSQYTDPFTGLGPDQTLAQQQQTAQGASQFATNKATAATSAANAAFNSGRASEGSLRVNPATGYYIDPTTGKDLPYGPQSKPSDGGFLKNAGQLISKNPWVLALPAAPFAVAGAGAAATGTTLGTQLGFDSGAAIGGSGASTLPYNYLASDAPTMNAPAAEAGAYNAGLGSPGAAVPTGGATTVTPGAGSTVATDAYNAAQNAYTAGAAELATPGAAESLPTATAVGAAPAVTPGAGSTVASGLTPWEKAGIQLGTTGLGVGADLLINAATSKPTKEEKALLATQQQLAQDAARRQFEVQQQAADNQAQRLVAMAPYNQLTAQMVGPQAAFNQQQMLSMTPTPPQPTIDPSLLNYTGTDPKMQAQVQQYLDELNQWQTANAARQQMVQSAFSQPMQGPAPIRKTQVLPAKKY